MNVEFSGFPFRHGRSTKHNPVPGCDLPLIDLPPHIRCYAICTAFAQFFLPVGKGRSRDGLYACPGVTLRPVLGFLHP